MPLFDRYLMVDWSASNSPKMGRDSIWIAETACGEKRPALTNPSTRAEAMADLETRLADALINGERVLAGFDFAFGYPAGSDRRLFGGDGWRAVWSAIADLIEDGDDNRSNRFDVAAHLNARAGEGDGPFWGVPHQHTGRFPQLGARRPSALPNDLKAARWCETLIPGAKSVWQLCYNGAVGSQTLLGIARLEALRQARWLKPWCRVWPFETAFANDLPTGPGVVLAEVYPSAFDIKRQRNDILDAAQVGTLASLFARLDSAGLLRQLLSAPADLGPLASRQAMDEEGWIIGVRAKEMLS